MSNEKCNATPHELADIGNKDIQRIRRRLYKLAGREGDAELPIAQEPTCWEAPEYPWPLGKPVLIGNHQRPASRVRDRGPNICVRQGFSVFKASYAMAEDALCSSYVVQFLREGGCLELEFRYTIDSDLNWHGDFGFFIWQIIRVYEIT